MNRVKSFQPLLTILFDGLSEPLAHPDINELTQVIANLIKLKLLHYRSESDLPKLGIAFVAMKRNIVDFPKVVLLGRSMGTDQISVIMINHIQQSSVTSCFLRVRFMKPDCR